MKRLAEKIYQDIGKYAIYYGVVALAAHLLSKTFFSLRYLSILALPHFQDFLGLFNLSKIQLQDILFYIMIIIGGILYQKTDKKDARLLRFTTSLLSLKGFLIFIETLLYFKHRINSVINIFFTGFGFIFSFLAIYLGYMLAQKLIADQTLSFTQTQPDGETYTTIKYASRKKRMAHVIFDAFLAFFLFAPTIIKTISYFSHSLYYQFTRFNDGLLPLLAIPILILYYLFFEGLYGSTPTKFLTGSTIISTKGEDRRNMSEFMKAKIPNTIETINHPNFKQILGRTFVRRVPFEPWSFFGRKGWHDKWTNTTVIIENTEGESRRYHTWWPVLFIGLYIGSIAFLYIQPMIERSRTSAFRRATEQTIRQTALANINTGDAIKSSINRPTDYSTSGRLFRVISVDGDHIVAGQYMLTSEMSQYPEAILNMFAHTQAIDTVELSKDAILSSFYGPEQIPLKIGTKEHFVNKLLDLDHPQLDATISYSSNLQINGFSRSSRLRIQHKKTPIDVINIKTIKGKAKWISKFPIEDEFDVVKQRGNLTLKVEKIDHYYKAEIILRYNEMEHPYILEGRKASVFLYRKK